MQPDIEDVSTKYTVIPITDKDHIRILEKYFSSNPFPSKASMCRFFLRGLCIFKKSYCKFAHGMDDLVQYNPPLQTDLTQKAIKKKEAAYRSFFNQKPSLFLIPKTNYHNLYEYNNQTSTKKLTIDDVNTQTSVRNKLRNRFHKYHWQKMIDFLEKQYPQANLTLPWIVEKYVEYGFTKPHTHCRVQGFVFWVNTCNFYIKHTIVLPPLLTEKTTMVFKRYSKRPFDKLLYADYEEQLKKGDKQEVNILKQIEEIKGKEELDPESQKKQLIKSYLTGAKPLNYKQCICKFYMKGVCFFQEQQCNYCHSFDSLIYIERQSKITDLDHYEQKSLMFENKRNYISLYKFQQRMVEIDSSYEVSSLHRVNTDSYLRQILRSSLHLDLYKQFMLRMRKQFPGAPLSVAFLRKEYNNCRLNKLESDKFPSFIERMEEIGYQLDAFVIPPETKKKEFVFERPSCQEMRIQFKEMFVKIIKQKIENEQGETPIFTESYIRRKSYQHQQPFTVALHRYLKIQNMSLKQFIQQQIDTNEELQPYLELISFDLKDNLEKIKEVLKDYYHKEKNRSQYSYAEIESVLRKSCGDRIISHFTANSFKWYILGESRELKKSIYSLPNGDVYIRNKINPKSKEALKQKQQHRDIIEQMKRVEVGNQQSEFKQCRIVLVDELKGLEYSEQILPHICTVGVDLQGNLCQQGYIYLVQLGFKNPWNNNSNQTIVFDIWKLKESPDLFKRAVQILKSTLESESVLKVMHDCKNDSVALYYLLGIEAKGIFDTSAMSSYYQQVEINNSTKSRQDFIKEFIKITNRNPGLNTILQKYKRPINELKQYMKTMFEAEQSVKIQYFQSRPLEKQFLEYAVRDVEELVYVFQEAVKGDVGEQWRRIGQVAARALIKN